MTFSSVIRVVNGKSFLFITYTHFGTTKAWKTEVRQCPSYSVDKSGRFRPQGNDKIALCSPDDGITPSRVLFDFDTGKPVKTETHLNGLLHSFNDHPAITTYKIGGGVNSMQWYSHGVRHRERGPAHVYDTTTTTCKLWIRHSLPFRHAHKPTTMEYDKTTGAILSKSWILPRPDGVISIRFNKEKEPSEITALSEKEERSFQIKWDSRPIYEIDTDEYDD